MTSTNQAYVPKIKNMRAIALAWWMNILEWKITTLFLEIRRVMR
jgi:hypothetical protein